MGGEREREREDCQSFKITGSTHTHLDSVSFKRLELGATPGCLPAWLQSAGARRRCPPESPGHQNPHLAAPSAFWGSATPASRRGVLKAPDPKGGRLTQPSSLPERPRPLAQPRLPRAPDALKDKASCRKSGEAHRHHWPPSQGMFLRSTSRGYAPGAQGRPKPWDRMRATPRPASRQRWPVVYPASDSQDPRSPGTQRPASGSTPRPPHSAGVPLSDFQF